MKHELSWGLWQFAWSVGLDKAAMGKVLASNCLTAQHLCCPKRGSKRCTVNACPRAAVLLALFAHLLGSLICQSLPSRLRQQSYCYAELSPTSLRLAPNMLSMGRVLLLDRRGPAAIMLC